MKKPILLLAGVMLLASACTLIDERYAGIGVWTSPSGGYDDYGDAYYPSSYYVPYSLYSPWSWSPYWRFGWYSWTPFFYMDPYFYLWSYSLYGHAYYSPWRYYGNYGGTYGYGAGYGGRRIDRTVVSRDSLRRLGSPDGTVRRIRVRPSSGSVSQVRRATTARSTSAGRSGTIRSSGSGRSGGTSRSSGPSRSGGSSGGGRSAGGGSIRKK